MPDARARALTARPSNIFRSRSVPCQHHHRLAWRAENWTVRTFFMTLTHHSSPVEWGLNHSSRKPLLSLFHRRSDDRWRAVDGTIGQSILVSRAHMSIAGYSASPIDLCTEPAHRPSNVPLPAGLARAGQDCKRGTTRCEELLGILMGSIGIFDKGAYSHAGGEPTEAASHRPALMIGRTKIRA